MRGEAHFTGFNANDLWPHSTYVQMFSADFRNGAWGIDAWRDESCLGAAIFRTYQNLPYVVTAMLGGPSALHPLLVLVLALQGLGFYLWARLWNLPPLTAVTASTLAPLVVSSLPMGHELASYLFAGLGMFTQALGLFPFLVCLGMIGRFSGVIASSKPQGSLELGLWLALSFLFHEFFGLMAWIALAIFVLVGLACRYIRWRETVRRALTVMICFLFLTAYQLLSIFQDRPLMHQSAWHLRERWDGIGFASATQLLFSGKLLDASGLPILSLLAAVGAVSAAWPKSLSRRRPERAALLLLIIAFLFLCGRIRAGGWLPSTWDLIPGLASLHLERFVVLVHLAAILLAAQGLVVLVHGLVHSTGRKRLPAILVLFLCMLGLETRLIGRVRYLRANDRMVALQEKAESRRDGTLFSVLAGSLRDGALWAGTPRDEDLPRLGVVPYFAIAEQEGFAQLSISPHSLTYGSDTPLLFDWLNRRHYRIFNVTAVIRPRGGAVPAFLTTAYANREVTLYRAPGNGSWEVAGVDSPDVVADGKAYLQAVRSWLDSPDLSAASYPGIVPRAIVQRWPSALAQASPRGPGAWGSVARSRRKASGDYEASLYSRRPGAYAILRTAYHPRWQIEVNGASVAPRWVAPGYLAVPLPLGKSEVRARFPADPFRAFLFKLTLASLLVSLLVCYFPKHLLTPIRFGSSTAHPASYTESIPKR